MKRLIILAISLFATMLAGTPASADFSLLDPHSWPFTLVPVPEVATDPNAGTTYGVLPVFLFNNDKNQIENIVAPDITGNTILGFGGTFRYLSYPSADTQWYVTAGAAQNIFRRVDAAVSTGRTRQDWLSFDGRFFFEKDPTERFFGIGNNSSQGNQTNYTTEQLYAAPALGLNITPKLQLSLMERPRWVRIHRGALKNLPFIRRQFRNVKGINGGSEVLSRAVLAYDTRDSPDIPRIGGLYRVFAGVADRRFMSSSSYSEFGAEVREFLPLGKRVTLAGRVYIEYIPAGAETPFWAQSRLGGQESFLGEQQTSRGFGAGRFVDNNLFDANLEVRTRVYELDIFKTHGVLELAPYIDLGRVFHNPDDIFLQHLHPVAGVGFRGIAEPFVVGFVDIGYGKEGTAFFSGINYPY